MMEMKKNIFLIPELCNVMIKSCVWNMSHLLRQKEKKNKTGRIIYLPYCSVEDTMATLFPIISSIAYRLPNISPGKGLMLGSISASETNTENGTRELPIQLKTSWGWTEAWPTLVQQLQKTRQVGRGVGRKQEFVQLNISGQI